MGTGPREWDATTYDRVAAPMTRMGSAVLDRLALRGDEVVLDAGCGSGQVTAKLAARLPRGRVIALDASAAMLGIARSALAPYDDRVAFVQADLSAPLPPMPLLDAVLSTATFHWVSGHDGLFDRLASRMKLGAHLVAQWGGAGNVSRVVEALADVADEFDGLAAWPGPWWFPSAEEVAAQLSAAGFVVDACWLHPEPVHLSTRASLEEYLATPILVAHLARLAPADRPRLVAAIADRIPDGQIDYVRVNVVAHLPPSSQPSSPS